VAGSDDKSLKNPWLLTGAISLFLVALFWSVDQSVIYFGLAIAIFSFFLYFRSGVGKIFTGTSSGSTRWASRAKGQRSEISAGRASGSGRPLTPHRIGNLIKTIVGLTFTVFFFGTMIWIFLNIDDIGFTDNYFKASEFSSVGEYDSAAHYYRLAAKEDPEYPVVYYEWGNTFLYRNRYDSALKLYDLAIALDEDYTEARYSKGYTFFQQQRYREAIEEARGIFGYEPNNLSALLLSGDCFYSQQQLDSALYYYDGAYSTGYRSSTLSHLLAYIYDTKGQTNKAIEYYKEAVAQDESLAEVYTRLAELVPGEEGNAYRTKAAQLTQ
jgi:tetratricopeptide (TPR) repeat protein